MIIGISGKKNSGKDTIADMIQQIDPKWERKAFANKLKEFLASILNIPVSKFEDREFKNTPLGPEWTQWKWNYVSWYYAEPESFDDCGSRSLTKASGICTSLSEARAKIQLVRKNDDNHMNGFDYASDINVVEMTPRLMMQLTGTNACTSIVHPNIWVNALMVDYEPLSCMPECKGIPACVAPTGYNCKEYPNWIITDVRFPNEAKAVKDAGGVLIRVNRKCEYCNQTGNTHKMGCERLQDEHLSETALDNYEQFDYIVQNNEGLKELINAVQFIYKEIES